MMQILGILISAMAVCAALVILARPHWGFVLLMVMFPLKQLLQVYVPVVANHPSWVNIAIGVIVLAATLTRFTRREAVGSAYLNRVTILVLILYALWLIGILYSPSREVFADRIWTDLTYQGLLLVFMPLLVLDIYEFRRALFGMMLVGAVICVLIMVNPRSEYYSGRLILHFGDLSSGKDTGNALATAGLGAMTALVAALFRPASGTFFVTVLRVGAFIAGMGMAIGSGSRGQVLAAGVVGVIFYPLSRKLANPKQFVVVAAGFMFLVGGIMAVFKLFISHANQDRWDPLGMLRDSLGRLEMVQNLLNQYLASPGHWLFGLGTGAYNVISTERRIDRDYVHNVAAEVLCEHGLVGFALFIIMMIMLVKMARQLFARFRDDPVMRPTVALLCAISLYALLEALKQGAMHYPAPFYWWIILAKLAQHEEKVAGAASAAIDEGEGEAVDDFSPINYDPPPGRPLPGLAG